MEQETWLFNVMTPLKFHVHTTPRYWDLIVSIKHPVMRGRLQNVIQTLKNPDEIRLSKRDSTVYLFYRKERANRWTCAVVKRLNDDGFLITTYPTDAIKEGRRIWPR